MNPRTVKELRDELGKYLDDTIVYAYEGEDTGIVFAKDGKELGFFPTMESRK